MCIATLLLLQDMRLVAAGEYDVGTTIEERARLAQRFDCHPTWLNDDLPRRRAKIDVFWIDRHLVTNAEYLAFSFATKRRAAVFAAEFANHPVVAVSGKDAREYAEWAGKRLPTAEEWEAAFQGEAFPEPVKRGAERIYWSLPRTRPVDAGANLGQCLEWIGTLVPHHGVQFQLLKGASWIHEDPLSFRAASGWYAFEGWRSAFTGFRCALDGTKTPPVVATAMHDKPAAIETPKPPAAGPITLSAAGGTSRAITIRAPNFGAESVVLSAPETITWNGKAALTWRHTPDITWTGPASYTMRFPDFTMRAEFVVREDGIMEQRFTAENPSDRPASFRTSSCFNLQTHPMFYDCEQLRTYALTSENKFVPMRRFSRGGDCVRWIAGMNSAELGRDLRWSLLAVVSRDGRSVIGCGRAGPGDQFSATTNALFTCLHTDQSIQVPAKGEATTRQYFYFLQGGLDELLRRFTADAAK